MRKTKIVCTMGPNTDIESNMRALVANGMDVARFNFSHGDYEEQKSRMNLLKKGERRAGEASGYPSGYQRPGNPYRRTGRRKESDPERK